MTQVLCRRCNRRMVPRVIFSRSISAGYGWRIGGGKPISNCCPFCLSEQWDLDTPVSRLRGGVLMKIASIPLTIILFVLLVGVFAKVSNHFGGSALLEWAGIILAIAATYKFGRWFVN
ncbi:MAG: hypothetical protein K2Y24_09770 [Pseudomonadaceae bacterium]|nr:hypothetical protein [Pseudomonadaceae bacterium]